jgi:hypothetical protein
MNRLSLTTLAAALITSGAVQASPTLVGVGDVSGGLKDWRVVDVRRGGHARVTANRPDATGGLGALEMELPAPGDSSYRAEVEVFSPDTVLEPGRGLVPVHGGYGLVTDLRDLLVSWYRDGSSTTFPWLSTAVRVYVYDPDLGINGTSSIMVWEPVYSGYATGPNFAVPVDQWVHSRLDDEIFWRQPLYLDGVRVPTSFCGNNPGECHVYDRRLRDWGFGPRTVIFGLNISAGSGWGGTFKGWVDNVNVEFTGGRTHIWDFEPGASAPAQVCETPQERRRRLRQARRAARRAARQAQR